MRYALAPPNVNTPLTRRRIAELLETYRLEAPLPSAQAGPVTGPSSRRAARVEHELSRHIGVEA
jgi:hypothetical protein